MSDLLNEYGAETKEIIGEEFLKSTSKAGEVYALPEHGPKTDVLGLVIRKDLVEELNLPVDEIVEAESFEELYKKYGCNDRDVFQNLSGTSGMSLFQAHKNRLLIG